MENATYEKYERRTVYAEVTGEYALPDYMGDVQKILVTEENVLPSGSFVSDGEIRFAGTVEHRVLYEDAEGILSEAVFTSDYETSLRCDTSALSGHTAVTALCGTSYRLAGPRKITSRTTVSVRVTLGQNVTLAVGGSAFDGGAEVLCKTETPMTYRKVAGERVEREYAEEVARFECPEGACVLIATSASSSVDGVKIGAGCALVSGKHSVRVLAKCGEEAPFLSEAEIPFEIEIPITGVSEGAKCTADANLSSVRASLRSDPDGMSAITVSLIADYTACAACEEQLAVVTDGFPVGAGSEEFFDDLSVEELVDAGVAKLTLTGESLRTGTECERMSRVIAGTATVKPTKITAESDAILLEGEMTFFAAGIGAGETSIEYPRMKCTVPFTERIPAPGAAPFDQVECDLRIGKVECTLDAEKIYASVPLSANYTVTRDHHMRRLDRIERSEDFEPRPAGRVTVFYPTADDTLWSVAKAYRVSTDKIVKDNALPEESIGGRERILILP